MMNIKGMLAALKVIYAMQYLTRFTLVDTLNEYFYITRLYEQYLEELQKLPLVISNCATEK